ncbi:MAG: hypothetical protein HZB52_01750 [Chloroflexi bacterium]|nr:hypothetical protein [Chloroflexota bacterium]
MQPDNRFQKLQDDYLALRKQLDTNRITPAQFDAAIKNLMVRDAQGRHWTLGAKDGKWYMHDGRAWVLANPPVATAPVSAPPIAAPPKNQRKSNRGCLIGGCVVVMLLCVLSVGGGFWAYQSGAFTLNNLLNVVGLGPGNIEVDNFRDDKIEVKITQLEPPKDSSPIQSSFRLSAFDVRSYTVSQPGKYRVEFSTVDKNIKLGACILNVRSGDQYQLVLLPERIVVNRANNPSSVGKDFVVETSSLCR